MKKILILDRKTLRKRKRKLYIQNLKAKLENWLIKQKSKKLIEQIRKEYVKTGESQIVLRKSHYNKNTTNALDYLKNQKLIDYEFSPSPLNERYYITICETTQQKE